MSGSYNNTFKISFDIYPCASNCLDASPIIVSIYQHVSIIPGPTEKAR